MSAPSTDTLRWLLDKAVTEWGADEVRRTLAYEHPEVVPEVTELVTLRSDLQRAQDVEAEARRQLTAALRREDRRRDEAASRRRGPLRPGGPVAR